MKAFRFLLLLLITSTLISNVNSLLAAPRRAVSCALLTGKIYCFGGDSPDGTTADTFLLMLDVTVPHSTSINSDWQTVNANNAYIATGARSSAQIAVLGDGDTMVINGGFTGSDPINQTIEYSASSNSWRVVDRFSDGVNGDRQIYWGTSIYVPSTQKIYYYGGMQDIRRYDWFVDTVTGTNFSHLPISANSSSGPAGFYRMTTLDFGSSTWSMPYQNSFTPNFNQYLNAVIFHPSSQTLYYFGGVYRDLNESVNFFVYSQPYDIAMTFNTSTSTWGQASFTGDIPSQRSQHTATLLPSEQDVLLYGGSTYIDDPAVWDYCYIANLQTFTWKLHNYMTPPKDDPATRTDHSAVLAGTKLFILFGYVTSKTALTNNVVLILDVSNPAQLSFVNDYEGLNASSSSGGSSIGAIVGGAVGGGVTLIIVAAVAFYCRKRKRAQEKAKQASAQLADENDHQEPVFVDWDDIEKKFTAVESVAAPSPMITPNRYHNTITYSSEQKTTVISNDSKHLPNEIKSVDQKTSNLKRDTSQSLGLSPAMTAASASPSASTLVSPYNPGIRQSAVLSTPDMSPAIAPVAQSPNVRNSNDNLLISQSFINIIKPDVGGE